MDEEELKKELRKWEQEIGRNPTNFRAHCNRGYVLNKFGFNEEALKSFDKALEINPCDDKIYFNRGCILSELGRPEEALISYDKALQINPKNEAIYCNKGNILDELGRNEEALLNYNKALEINPNHDATYCNRGNILNELGQKEEALLNYNKALEINPNDSVTYCNRGNVLNELNHKDEALLNYNKALEINPKNDTAWSNRGNVLNGLDRKEEALKSYDKSLEINPINNAVWFNRGTVLNELDRKEEALKSYDKSLEINPNNDSAWFNRGNVLNELDRKEEALKSYDKSLEINPINDSVWFNQGNVLSELGYNKEALESYNKSLEINPDKDEAYCNRGSVLLELGYKDDALINYDKALKINANDDVTLSNKGLLLSTLGKQEEALGFYIQAIQKNANNELAKRNRIFLIGNKEFWNSLSENIQPDLWSGDDDFSTLASKKKLQECSGKDLQCIRHLWVEQYRLLYLLSANLENVGHYTSSTVFETLLQEEGKAAPLRLCSVAAANDPTEGTVFLSLLHQDCMPSPRIQSDLAVLQTSFSSAIDSLNQFRLYGKKDGEEGTGLCLVFNRDFFAAPGEASMIAVKRGEEQSLREETETGHKLPLYWVLYYDCESGHVYYTPACMEYSLNQELEITEDSLQEDVRKRVKDIGESLKRIRTHFQAIDKKYQQTALEMLIYLRHLVKDAAFKDEKELRILSLHPYNDPSLKVLPGKDCLSVDYLPVIHDGEEYLNQVIAGPKLRDFTNLVDVARFRLHHLGGKKEVEFRQSRAPLS